MSPTRPTKGKGKASDSDNAAPSKTSGRSRKESSRAREGRQNAAEVAAVHANKRLTQQERREERRLEQIEEMLVEQEGETQREAQYREFASVMQAKHDTMAAQHEQMAARLARMEASMLQRQRESEYNSAPSAPGPSHAIAASDTPGAGHAVPAATSGPAHPAGHAAHAPYLSAPNRVMPTPEPFSIRPPDKLSDVTMGQIRGYLGLKEGDTRWLEIRATVRDLMALAMLDLKTPWKQQNKTRLGNLYALMLERIPEFKRFLDNWAAELIVRDIFNHRRTFRNSKDPNWVKRPPRGKRTRTACPAPSFDSDKRSTHSGRSSPPPSDPRSEPELETGQAATPRDRTPPPPPPSSPPPVPAGHQNKRLPPPELEELGAEDSAEPLVPNSEVRRNARHAAAIAAADAAANDDQRAATQEKSKKAGTAKKAGTGKPRGRPPKGGKSRGKGKNKASDEDELFPEPTEPCDS